MYSDRTFLMFSILMACIGSCFSFDSSAVNQHDAIDYASGKAWLCHPDKGPKCERDIDTTLIQANGSTALENWRPDPAPRIDCFYVYPTVSNDRQPNSDLHPAEEEEIRVMREQFQRFGTHCRLFAPLYRQRTVPSLMAQVPQGDPRVAYGDVKAAWNSYLASTPAARGVVLIGHSQGADILKKLIKEEIDTKPARTRLVSAILLGTAVTVPPGKDIGGDFVSIPACRSDRQLQCVISYSSFRSTMPPSAGAAHGRHAINGMHTLCTNPASLDGRSGTLVPYFPSRRGGSETQKVKGSDTSWLSNGAQLRTQFVSLPEMLTSRCVQDQSNSFLEVTVHSNASDKRTKDIGGDMIYGGRIQPQWGLHLIDMHLALGNLVDIVGRQAEHYSKR